MKREAKIGLFLGGALFIMAVFIFIVGDLSVLFQKAGYSIYASFESASGIETSAVVKLAGVKVGYAGEIKLVGRRARVKMVISPHVNIPKDSRATIATLGLLGEKYLEIIAGEKEQFCSAGDEIAGMTPISFENIGNLLFSAGEEIKKVAESIRGITSGESGEKIKAAVGNLSVLTADMSRFLEENRAAVKDGIQSVSRTAKSLDDQAGKVASELDKTLAMLRDVAGENKESLRSDLRKIDELVTKMQEAVSLLNETLRKINRGEGTVGKLVQDPALYDQARDALGEVKRLSDPVSKMKGSFDVRAEYLGQTEKARGVLGVSWWPTPGSLYQAQIVRDPSGERFVYSLQGGLRWGALVPRAGLIESSFGAGLDVLALGDRLRFSLDAFDINRHPGPRFRVSTRYSLHKNFFLTLGVDDFSLAAKRQAFFGLGVGR